MATINVMGEQVTDEGLTIGQIARRCGVTEQLVRLWLRRGAPSPRGRVRLNPAFRLGGQGWRVRADDVDAWVREYIDADFVPLVLEEPAPDEDDERAELTAELAALEEHKAGLADQMAELRARLILDGVTIDGDPPHVRNRIAGLGGMG